MTFLDVYDIRTAYPLLLHLLDKGLNSQDWREVSAILESYLLRRAVCGLSTKNYNRVFLTLTRALHKGGTGPTEVRAYLQGLTGESSEWPTDETFARAWMNMHAYRALQHPKIVHILRRLNSTYIAAKQEAITIESPLTIEHLLPQRWEDNWPLPDGSKGLDSLDLFVAEPDDSRANLTRTRNERLQTFGNLTILTSPLNASLSNSAWATKKPALLTASLLPVNQQLHQYDEWDERSIATRGNELLQKALAIWPRP